MGVHFCTYDKIAETSSKGNQEKWFENNRWYKLDQFGYEALAESLISDLLELSNIETSTPFTFTRYRIERISVHGRERTCCSSESFLKPGQSIITVAHLFKRMSEVPLQDALSKLTSDKKRLEYIARSAGEITGLDMFPQYLTLLFETDALFLNDDRHLNNIAVLEQNGRFDYCPVFDNGAGLLSNILTAPMNIAPKALVASAAARPMNTSFNRQINSMRALFGAQLQMPKLDRRYILSRLAPLLPYYPERDRDLISDRVCETILTRQKYQIN